jgi:TATA-box binding protein (TBP) (component of TFIID and TFIIIB)
MSLTFTNYRISTITCNADITCEDNNCRINLKELFDNIILSNEINHFVWAIYVTDNNEFIRGEYPKKKRKNKSTNLKKRRFDNQVSFIFKLDDNYYPNLKIFQNGNIQMAGPRSFDDTKKPLDAILKIINDLYDKGIDILSTPKTNDIIYSNFKIRLINTDFKIFKNDKPFMIKRKELHRLLVQNNDIIARFSPIEYPGVKIAYYWDSLYPDNNGKFMRDKLILGKNNDSTIKKVTIAVFESGSCLITGAITLEQINQAYNYIISFIQQHKEQVGMLYV